MLEKHAAFIVQITPGMLFVFETLPPDQAIAVLSGL
jgi:hypothetical protein